MKTELIVIVLSFIIGAAYSAHAAHVFDKSHVQVNGSTYLYYHIQSEFLKFMIFLPIALIYFTLAILITGLPQYRFPYIAFIIFTGGFLMAAALNSFMGNPYPQMNMVTKYGHGIDFPLVKTIQLISMLITVYVFMKKFCIGFKSYNSQ